MNDHTFGSDGWTEEKLDVVMKFAGFFTRALSEKNLRVRFIDAFAGTGKRMQKGDGDGVAREGSALKAMKVDPPFELCTFIELDPGKAEILRQRLQASYSNRWEVLPGDANEEVRRICASFPLGHRAMVFLDPFATQVEWETLQAIAATEKMDLWFLVPLMAITRMMPREGRIPPEFKGALIRMFGEDPESELYRPGDQPPLFEEMDEEFLRQGGSKNLIRYIVKRLRSIFHGHVAPECLLLCNSKNSPMFLLVYAMANPAPKAVALAKRVVKDILGRHQREGGNVIRVDD